jgi:hypothetical protein
MFPEVSAVERPVEDATLSKGDEVLTPEYSSATREAPERPTRLTVKEEPPVTFLA